MADVRRDAVADGGISLASAIRRELCQRSFWRFFQHMDPTAILGWWQEDAARHLQQFYDDLVAGRRPKLVICAPPQHGKSRLIVDFLGWVIGKHPELRIVYAAFSDRLSTRANARIQRILDSARFKEVFPGVGLNSENVVTQTAKPKRNSTLLEILGPRSGELLENGYFRNTTVNGPITGESVDLGVLDDPIKGRDEAESETIRNKTWEWLNDDMFTRFSDRAGFLSILTRWHLDDPIGRLCKSDATVKVVRYQAIAESETDAGVAEGFRGIGDVLFPEFKSREFVYEVRDRLNRTRPFAWQSLYQQNPVPREGGVVKIQWLERRFRARGRNPIQVVQSIDCASKPKERNDPTAHGTFAIFRDHVELWHVVVRRLEFPDLLRLVKDLYGKDWGTGRRPNAVLIEDKDAGQQLIQTLRRETSIPVVACDPEGVDKLTRLDAEAPFIESGGLWLPDPQYVPDATWVADFVAELTTIPSAPHDDQGDMLSQFLKWHRRRRYVRPPGPAGDDRASPNIV